MRGLFLVGLMVAATLGGFTGCGDGGNGSTGGGGGTDTSSAKSISKDELASDIQNVNAAEQKLVDAGLSFTSDTTNGVTTYRWNKYALANASLVPTSQRIVALQNYIQITDGYLAKYTGNFKVDGEDPNELYEVTNVDTIRTKNELAKKTLDRLSSMQPNE